MPVCTGYGRKREGDECMRTGKHYTCIVSLFSFELVNTSYSFTPFVIKSFPWSQTTPPSNHIVGHPTEDQHSMPVDSTKTVRPSYVWTGENDQPAVNDDFLRMHRFPIDHCYNSLRNPGCTLTQRSASRWFTVLVSGFLCFISVLLKHV